MELNNYRPISVLKIFSKIFERLMYNKSNSWINIIFLIKINLDLDKDTLLTMHLSHW